MAFASPEIDGWLTEKEGRFLYEKARECSGRGVIVEIGSWKGKSTACLAKGAKDGGSGVMVYAIDPHTGSPEHEGSSEGTLNTFDEFKKNMKDASVDDVVIPVVKTSEEAAGDWDKPVELLFIDGMHEYEFVEKDFRLWTPLLVDGGTLVVHDTTASLGNWLRYWSGPKKVVERFVFGSKNFKDIGLVDTITHARKCMENSFTDRVENRLVRLKKLFPDSTHIIVMTRNIVGPKIPKKLKHCRRKPI